MLLSYSFYRSTSLRRYLFLDIVDISAVIHISDKTGVHDSVFLTHFYSNVKKRQQYKATSRVIFHCPILLSYLSEFLKLNVVFDNMKDI